MKKIALFVAVLAMVGMTLTSCDKDKERCWKVNTKVTIGELVTESTTHIWASENDIEAAIEEIRKTNEIVPNAEVKITKMISTEKTAEDCTAANVPTK